MLILILSVVRGVSSADGGHLVVESGVTILRLMMNWGDGRRRGGEMGLCVAALVPYIVMHIEAIKHGMGRRGGECLLGQWYGLNHRRVDAGSTSYERS